MGKTLIWLVSGSPGIQLRHYNPALYDFASTSFLRRMSLANRPSKFLLSCIGLGIIQSFVHHPFTVLP